ncbi:MAG: hypothetical protein IT313_01385 [Anaerolineales bacterium]|nr:hypothetical protein [Anaerolineales bacterium]
MLRYLLKNKLKITELFSPRFAPTLQAWEAGSFRHVPPSRVETFHRLIPPPIEAP